MLPVVDRKLAISGRLGENLSVKEGKEAARIASLNALAAAKQHLSGLDRLKKLVKLTVLMATTEDFAEHAPVADGASELFVQLFGQEAGHVRLVYGVYSLPIGAPVIVDVIFEIEPARQSKRGKSHERSRIDSRRSAMPDKDSKKHAPTGGWGFADFKGGEPGNQALHETCFPCHAPAKATDFVFTRYTP
jgi:enamine deaminase RidA (YjgF/YER057c/UK114 family)